MFRDDRCYWLTNGLEWNEIEWRDDPIQVVGRKNSRALATRPQRSDYQVHQGGRIIETIELSDSYLVAGSFGGRYLKDRSGAWKSAWDLDSFWQLGGKIHGVSAGATVPLLGLGFSGQTYGETTKYVGTGYQETGEPVAVVSVNGVDLNYDYLLGHCRGGSHGVWQDTESCTVFLVSYMSDSGRSRVISNPTSLARNPLYEVKSRTTQELPGLALFCELTNDIFVFVAEDIIGSADLESRTTLMSIIHADGTVTDGLVTGFPSTYFGDRVVAVNNRIFAAHERTLFVFDKESLHFNPIRMLDDEVVSLLNVDETLIAFTLADIEAMPIAVVVTDF